MNPRQIPNAITLARILLVLPLAWAVLDLRYGLALALFATAAASDGIDGFLARRFGWHTRLGAVLDPLADKLLLVTCYVLLGFQGQLPWWLVLAVLLRDLIIVGGGLAYHVFIGFVQMAPTVVSKLNTALQIALVVIVFIALWRYPLAPDLRDSLMYTVFASTLLSGLNYVWVWGRRARALARERSGT